MTKNTTLATIKAFIRREAKNGNLYARSLSSFDGSVDCVMPTETEWKKVESVDFEKKYTFGIPSAWFVGSSRDYFDPFEDAEYIGYKVFNACGSFIIAMRRIA